MIRYLVFPGLVVSGDNDVHYITGEQLIRLYGVDRRYCKIIRSEEDMRTIRPEQVPWMIQLHPSPSGNYNLKEQKSEVS